MTIPTPTSEGLAALGGTAPAGLPDEGSLARLAGEFFAALPSGLPGPGSAPASPPEAPAEIRLGDAGPQLLAAAPFAPVQAESVPLDHASAAGPAGRPALGVPEAYAAALPTFSPPLSPPPLAPSSPNNGAGFQADAVIRLEVPVRYGGGFLPPMTINLKMQAKYMPLF